VTALAGSRVAARRMQLGNLVARRAIGLAFLPFLNWAAMLLSNLSSDPGRAVLNFHTSLHIVFATMYLRLLELLAKLVTWMLPTPSGAPERAAAQHLEASVLDTPSEALGCAMRETLRLGDIVLEMLRKLLIAIEGHDLKVVKEIAK